MRSVSWWAVAAVAAPLCCAVAQAETEAEYASRPPVGARSPAPPPRTTPRPVFAPSAAASARRLAPHEREERRFLREAAAASRFQAEAARLVQAKSSDPGVRSLAIAIGSHHSASGDALLRMLHRRGMAAPMLENAQRRTLTRLVRLQGAKLDRTYVTEVAVHAQQETIDGYERASAEVQDPALREWLAQSLPALRSHVAGAERLARAGPARVSGHSAAPRSRRGQRVE